MAPYTLIQENWFCIWWWKIVGAKWNFEVKENEIIADITLPSPTTRQLQSYCGNGVVKKFYPVQLKWIYNLPENILLIPNSKICETFSDESFLGLCIPVRTVDENVQFSLS